MNDQPLSGRVALVTGASRGIGAATARALAARGAHVVITARTASDLEQVEEAIFAAGGSATIAPLDLTQNDSIARLAIALGERWQALDLLVLNAATLGTLAAVPAFDARELAQVLTLNVSAQAALLGAFDPMLRASDSAGVIALTSSVARTPRAFWGMYGASKAAFENLVMAYGDEVENTSKVRVAIVDPGATRTKMRERAFPGEDPQTLKSPDVVGERIADLAVAGFDTGHIERIAG
ncbi:short-subunit dehydrogenase [Hephaestia caeni]|uniref:Short-subunit dehydrogenase n=1 Tax=Hephaestia caeni TaxID=645617 RepID=A0A397P9W4_9SPHN|nr:SDR family NAD(P)-dependent oxidoreductase [Hephaestia caeni]RIA45718.1 short-subunit dehydrogenase [Hephaestia caeni]